MRTIAEFTKTTLIGGILVVLPIYVSVILVAKAMSSLLALVTPITNQLPAYIEFRQLLAVVVLAIICFVAGAIVRTGPELRAKTIFEELQKLPRYTLLRGLAGRIAGQTEAATFAPPPTCWCRCSPSMPARIPRHSGVAC